MNVPRKKCGNCFSDIEKRGGICPVCGYAKGMSGEPSVLSRGKKLGGRYVIGGCIGSGGFGITYLAFDLKDGRTVAVKEYFPSMLARREKGVRVVPNGVKSARQYNIGAEKFFDEAELVRRFNGNSGVVSIYECFYENNTAYYVMEYLDGITLENYVRKYGALSSAQTLYIADKVTMALMVLHSGKVLHRDISPDNVMICRDGGVKLIDFGAARQLLAGGTDGLTVIMKTGFSPPEQYLNDSEADIRADIYSLGTTLYYALTGKIPENPYQRRENDDAFTENSANADSGLWEVIHKAAAVSSEERYKNAEAMRNALDKLNVTAEEICVPKDHNPLKSEALAQSKPPKRVKARFIAIAAAAVIAAGAVTLSVNGLPGSRFTEHKPVELTLDSEYAGHFNVGGRISSELLEQFGGDVEITIFIGPKEDMPPNDVRGVIPVDSNRKSMLSEFTAPETLWADENGWISIENDSDRLTLILSRKGVEALEGNGLGFETYNLIITSAVLKPSEKGLPININNYYKNRNAPYSVTVGTSEKTVSVHLEDSRTTDWPTFETQAIPKSAFYEFDGDVKMTLSIEYDEDPANVWCNFYVRNSGSCFNVFDDDFLVPAVKSGSGEALLNRDEDFSIIVKRKLKQIDIVIPSEIKAKMSEGVFFQCVNLKVTDAILEDYFGEYDEFI